jgi:hypothetical protein
MTAFALCSSVHTVSSIRIVMAVSTVTNQLVNKICLFAPLSTHFEKGHRSRIDFFKGVIYETFSLKKDLISKGLGRNFSVINCDYGEKNWSSRVNSHSCFTS